MNSQQISQAKTQKAWKLHSTLYLVAMAKIIVILAWGTISQDVMGYHCKMRELIIIILFYLSRSPPLCHEKHLYGCTTNWIYLVFFENPIYTASPKQHAMNSLLKLFPISDNSDILQTLFINKSHHTLNFADWLWDDQPYLHIGRVSQKY